MIDLIWWVYFILLISVVVVVVKIVIPLIYKNKINFNILVNLLVILSIVFGALLFMANQWDERKINEENKKIILGGLKVEIGLNIGYIDRFNSSLSYLVYSHSVYYPRLDYFYLEKSLEFIDDKTIRERIIQAIQGIKLTNRLLEAQIEGTKGLDSIKDVGYFVNKKQNYEKIDYDYQKYIKPLLELINKSID